MSEVLEPQVGIQELYCHHCGQYVLFKTKPENNGNLIIPCKCGHDHKRFVVNGIVTRDRWGATNGMVERMITKRRRKGAHEYINGFFNYERALKRQWR